jgi:hypothetical protein
MMDARTDPDYLRKLHSAHSYWVAVLALSSCVTRSEWQSKPLDGVGAGAVPVSNGSADCLRHSSSLSCYNRESRPSKHQ